MTIHDKSIIALPVDALTPIEFPFEPDSLDCESYTQDALTIFGRCTAPYALLRDYYNDPLWQQKEPPLTRAFLRDGWDRAMKSMEAIIASFTALKVARENWQRVAAINTIELAHCELKHLPTGDFKARRDEANRRADELKELIFRERVRFEEVQKVLLLQVFAGYAHYFGLDGAQQLCDMPLSERHPVPLPNLEQVTFDEQALPN